MNNIYRNRTILVTGGTGSIGSELVKQLLTYKPKQIRVFSRDESKQYYLLEQLRHHESLRFLIGDIRDQERLDFAFNKVDYVFHAAALKHVPLCEYNPFEAVKTNIVGSQNIIDSALKHNVYSVVAISTDKAANPGNVMGTSKLMMEKLITNANYYRGDCRTRFCCVRFGNVAWARGSVLPLWKKQAERDGSIMVTDNGMTRFFMSITQATALILRTAELTRGGEIFILKMPSVKLRDLAKIFLQKYFPKQKIRIEAMEPRAGEKQHEELFTNSFQPKRIFENLEMLIVIPELNILDLIQKGGEYAGFKRKKTIGEYSSKNSINLAKISTIV